MINEIESAPVKDICVGVYNTMVHSKRCGLASTLRENTCHGRGLEKIKNIDQLDVADIARLSLSPKLLEASLGIAAINSALPVCKENLIRYNAKHILAEKGMNKVVSVIGHFPFLETIKANFKELYIFEKQPRLGDWLEKDIKKLLPRADVVAITATSLINHTFSEILKYRKKGCYTILLGPSTPLSPVMFEFGIDMVAGSLCRYPEQLMPQIKMAIPFRFLCGVEYYTLVKK